MSSAKIARLVLVKERVRDAARAKLADAERALQACEQDVVVAQRRERVAVEQLAVDAVVSLGDLELRAREVTESGLRVSAAETACTERRRAVQLEQTERLEAERDVKMLRVVEGRRRDEERMEIDRHEAREADERAASKRRSA